MNKKVSFKIKKNLVFRRDMMDRSISVKNSTTLYRDSTPENIINNSRVKFISPKIAERLKKPRHGHNKSMQISTRGEC